jgi:hypothetical protein
MRFEVRWNNGYWKVFDTHKYTDVNKAFLKKDALAQVKKLNKGKV